MILSSMSRLVAVFRGDAPPGMELLECSNGRFFSSTEGSASAVGQNKRSGGENKKKAAGG
jgi:hypothetical protein